MKLANVFQSSMVLQQNATVAIWGWAEAGEAISVEGSWGRSSATITGDDGRWMTRIETPAAGGPYTVTVTGTAVITFEDVLIGEVWLCSGQSNMEWVLGNAIGADLEIACATDPLIRQLKVERSASAEPADDCTCSWSVCSPETAGQFTAVGYFFAKALREVLGVPVGLLNASWGGSRIEAWLPREQCDASLCVEGTAKQQHSAAKLYNGMIHSIKPYGTRGILWYQGESNAHNFDNIALFRKHLHCLAESWRCDWRDDLVDGNMPLYLVQLPNYKEVSAEPAPPNALWAAIREVFAQAADEIPDCEIAVTLDVGEGNDIHPRNKQDVGKRLARLALHHTYGKDILPGGPVYASHRIEENRIVVEFDNVGKGLVSFGGKLDGFVVAGEDKCFVWAQAEIVENAVVVSAEGVDSPVAVRYAWADNAAQANLTSISRLPAAPFRTDDWELV